MEHNGNDYKEVSDIELQTTRFSIHFGLYLCT